VPAGSDRQTFQIATPFLTSFTATGGVNTVTIRTGLATSNNLAQITDGTSNTILLPQTPATSAVLTLFPQRSLASVAASPSPVTGGSPITVTLTIPREAASRDPTPPPTGTEGTVELKPDNPSLVRLPTSVAIPAGALTVLVNGTTTIPTADQTVVITAVHVSTLTTSLTVKKPIPVLALFSLRPTTVTGGQNFIASLQLSSAITSPQVVRLSIDHTGLVVLPDSVTIPVSSVPTSFTFKTNPVTVQTTATVTAIAGTQRIPVALTIVP
jgi:hypothetical protein